MIVPYIFSVEPHVHSFLIQRTMLIEWEGKILERIQVWGDVQRVQKEGD